MTLAPVPPTRGHDLVATESVAGTDPVEGAPPQMRRGSLGKITTRPSVAQDSAFMLELYASTSRDVLDNLGWSIGGNRTFVIMQAQTEEWNRARQYPGMDRLTICVDEMPVGRLLVCLRNNILHVVDLSLLPRFRGLGIGSQLMGEILDEARNARVPVKVRVVKNSGSLRFAERLGFTTPTDLGQYVELTWMPPLTALGPDAREEGFVSHGTRANRSVPEQPLDNTPGHAFDGAPGHAFDGAADNLDVGATPDFSTFAPIEPIEPTEPTEVVEAAPPHADLTATAEVELPATTGDSVVDPVTEPPVPGTDASVQGSPDPAADSGPVEPADETPNGDTNDAVLAYVAEADSEYLAEPVWLAPEVVVEDESEGEDEPAEEEPEVEQDPRVTARNAEYIDAVTATDAFTLSFSASFSGEVPEDDDTDEDENLPLGADRYDPFA